MKNDTTIRTREIREMTDEMIEIATKGSQKSECEPLILIYGLILDCAHKIRQTMDREAQDIHNQVSE